MELKWVVNNSDEQKAEVLQKALGINITLCRLLVQRGIETYEEAKCFFRPCLTQLHDPFLMKGMDKAVERIDAAISNNEKILIYGDYDVDGTTSVALVYSYITEFYANVEYYVPNRYTEGYGISTQSIDWSSEQGISLVIALDCGIRAVDKIAYANDKAIDFIICDHHLPGEVIPDAVAVLDPKQIDCPYPYKELSGCGVGFKLIQALSIAFNRPITSIYQYLDLVAVSIACDIVPITGENRILAYHGVKKINEQPIAGLAALANTSNIERELKITDFVFAIGPRINAAGRMDDAKWAVRVLTAPSIEEGMQRCKILQEQNSERREIDSRITEEAEEMIAEMEVDNDRTTTVLFDPNWHKGVIGIVASRLLEKHYRPTIVLTESEGKVTGSARSVKGFNIHDAIESCSDLLINFGGHKYAAGLTMEPENVDLFIKRFEEVVSHTITEASLVPELVIDADLNLEEVKGSFFKVLEQFAPFGPGNMKPVFRVNNVKDTGYGRVVGKSHLKLNLKQDSSMTFGAIAFNKGTFSYEMGINSNGQHQRTNSKPIDVCFTLEENEWQGRTQIQMNVKDLRIANLLKVNA